GDGIGSGTRTDRNVEARDIVAGALTGLLCFRPETRLTEFKPIRRLAIANRGEAAMRCIRAVKSLGALESSGIQVIALYTDVDRAAPFVRHADVAVRLPTNGGTAVSAYLNHDLLISVL